MVRLNNKKWKKPPVSNYQKYRSQQVFNGSKPDGKEFTFPKWIIKPVFGLILLGGGAYFLLYSKIFAIKEVIVEGTKLVSAEEVRGFVPVGGNIFRFNLTKTKNDLLKSKPEISRVEIYRGIPNAVKFVLLEKEGKLVWQSGENLYLISNEGEVARKIVGDEGNGLPKVIDKKGLAVTPGDRLVSPNFIAFVHNIYNGFYDTVNIKPTDFEVDETTFDVMLKTEAGFYVKFNSLRSSKKQLESLKSVLVSKRLDIKEYVDLRIDGWAYYK